MTVQELIEALQALPRSARTATVTMAYQDGEEECTTSIAEVRYEHGEATIESEHRCTAIIGYDSDDE